MPVNFSAEGRGVPRIALAVIATAVLSLGTVVPTGAQSPADPDAAVEAGAEALGQFWWYDASTDRVRPPADVRSSSQADPSQEGAPIYFGEQIYIRNEHFDGQYLTPHTNNYLTTTRAKKYRWRIEAK